MNKLDSEDLKAILEYQNLYDINIYINTIKQYEKIEKTATELIEKLITMQENKAITNNNNLYIRNEIKNLIETIRKEIIKMDKNKLIQMEAVLEKLQEIRKWKKRKGKIKNKAGRPKKGQINIDDKRQYTLEQMFID